MRTQPLPRPGPEELRRTRSRSPRDKGGKKGEKGMGKGGKQDTDAKRPAKQERWPRPPGEGYICRICKEPGHWIQECPQKKAKGGDPATTRGGLCRYWIQGACHFGNNCRQVHPDLRRDVRD